MLVEGRPHRGTESQEATRREAGAWTAHPLCPSFGPLPPAGPCCSAGCAAKGQDPFPALGSSSGGCLGIRRAGPAATKGPGQPHGGTGIKEPAFDTAQGATHHEGHVTHVFHQPLTWSNQTWPGKGPLAAGVEKAPHTCRKGLYPERRQDRLPERVWGEGARRDAPGTARGRQPDVSHRRKHSRHALQRVHSLAGTHRSCMLTSTHKPARGCFWQLYS